MLDAAAHSYGCFYFLAYCTSGLRWLMPPGLTFVASWRASCGWKGVDALQHDVMGWLVREEEPAQMQEAKANAQGTSVDLSGQEQECQVCLCLVHAQFNNHSAVSDTAELTGHFRSTPLSQTPGHMIVLDGPGLVGPVKCVIYVNVWDKNGIRCVQLRFQVLQMIQVQISGRVLDC